MQATPPSAACSPTAPVPRTKPMTNGTHMRQRLTAAGAARRGVVAYFSAAPWSIGTGDTAAKPCTSMVTDHFGNPTNRWPEEAPL